MKKPKPDDLDGALAAAQAKFDAAMQVERGLEAELAGGQAAEKTSRDEAAAYGAQLATGAPGDPAGLRARASAIAICAHENAIRASALGEAKRLTAAAYVEVRKAIWRLKQREAKRLRAGEGRSYIELQDATDKFVDAVEAARAAAAARLDKDAEVEFLRCELAGISPATRANYFPIELQTPRLLAALPSSWLFEINVGWPVGDSDFRARGERLIKSAAA